MRFPAPHLENKPSRAIGGVALTKDRAWTVPGFRRRTLEMEFQPGLKNCALTNLHFGGARERASNLSLGSGGAACAKLRKIKLVTALGDAKPGLTLLGEGKSRR